MWSPNELLKIEKQRDILSYITLQFFHFKKVPLEHCPLRYGLFLCSLRSKSKSKSSFGAGPSGAEIKCPQSPCAQFHRYDRHSCLLSEEIKLFASIKLEDLLRQVITYYADFAAWSAGQISRQSK